MPATIILQELVGPGSTWQWVTLILAILGEILSVIFVVRVLSKGGAPASTLAWMLFILIAPYAGLVLYYLLPRRLHVRRVKRRRLRLRGMDDSLAGLGAPGAERGENPLLGLLARLDVDAVRSGNEVRMLPQGVDFFREVAAAVDGARRYVHLETYILRPDETGILLLAKLTQAARRGVEVRLLYDSFGSWGLRARHTAELVAAGGKVRAFLPILWKRRPFTINFRNHRKLVVVDGELAILGGRNVGDEYAKDKFGSGGRVWLDVMVAIEGPILPRLHRVFVEDWLHAAEEDLAREQYFTPQEPCGECTVGVVDSGPDRKTDDTRWTLFQLVTMARCTLEISTPYLIPPPTLLLALQVAARRGVEVCIHTNGPEAENWVLYRAQRSYYGPLLEAGVAVFETTGDYNHAKMVVVDRETVFVGSANWDQRSAELNFEIGVAVIDQATAREAGALFSERCQQGRPFRAQDLASSLPARVVEGACRLLSPLL